MEIGTFVAGGATRLGAAMPDSAGARAILDLEAAARRVEAVPEVRQALALGQFADSLQFLEGGEAAMAAARALIERVASVPECLYRSDQVQLRPPVPRARKLLCLAGNYREHIREGGGTPLGKEETYPYFFMKPPSTGLIGSGEPIRLPRIGQEIDWEGELAVVIGRRGRHIRASEADQYVAGYTCFNDISERRLAVPEGRTPRERDRFFDWLVGKWFDTAAPAGPYLVTREQIPDPHRLALKLRVNGVVKQDASTGDMIFSVPELIEFISRIVTLEPGDMIATGTAAGVGASRKEFLKPGDSVEVEIEGLGILRNPVVGEG